MSLMSGFANKTADIYHKSIAKTASGGGTETWTLAIASLSCRIDHKSGVLNRLLVGEEGKNYDILYCDYRTDIREGDKVTNVRDSAGNVQYDYRNGAQRAAEYIVTRVNVPGSELDHLEIDIYKVAGQTLT